MTTLHLTETKPIAEPIIFRRKPVDLRSVLEPKVADPMPPKGSNIFSLARTICRRAVDEQPPTKLAA